MFVYNDFHADILLFLFFVTYFSIEIPNLEQDNNKKNNIYKIFQ